MTEMLESTSALDPSPDAAEAPPPASSRTRLRGAGRGVCLARAQPRDGLDFWRLHLHGQLSPYDFVSMLRRGGAIAHVARDEDGAPRGFALALDLEDHVTLVDAAAVGTSELVSLLAAVVNDVREAGYDWLEPSPFCAPSTQELLYSLAGTRLAKVRDERAHALQAV